MSLFVFYEWFINLGLHVIFRSKTVIVSPSMSRRRRQPEVQILQVGCQAYSFYECSLFTFWHWNYYQGFNRTHSMQCYYDFIIKYCTIHCVWFNSYCCYRLTNIRNFYSFQLKHYPRPWHDLNLNQGHSMIGKEMSLIDSFPFKVQPGYLFPTRGWISHAYFPY